MIVSATALANDSKNIIDRVLNRRETAEVQRHGKAIVQIRRKVGTTAADLIERLKQAGLTAAESKELKAAMDAANRNFTDANRH
jgi:hypothetical protein